MVAFVYFLVLIITFMNSESILRLQNPVLPDFTLSRSFISLAKECIKSYYLLRILLATC